MRKKILLMAYAISPNRGSEYSLGWNFTTKMAEHNDLVVLYGTSGDYFGDYRDLQEHLKQYPVENVRFIPVEPNRAVRFLNFFNKVGFGPAFYIAFKMWHRTAYAIARDLQKKEKFDLVHQLGPIGFREPGYLWKLDLPFIWGPVGGAQFVHSALLTNIPKSSAMLFKLKNIANYCQLRFSSRVRTAAAKADRMIFATEANRINFARFLRKDGPVISELACADITKSESTQARKSPAATDTGPALNQHDCKENDEQSVLKAVWCGHLSTRKNLHFLLHALSRVQERSAWRLTVIGDGKIRGKLMKLASQLGIASNISWAGGHNRAGAIELMKGNDVHLMCSLAEANTAVFYEATDLGIPTLALDQDGMTRELSHGNGVLVAITDYDSTLSAYAQKIDGLIRTPGQLKNLKERTDVMRDEFSWEKKIRAFDKIYDEALAEYKGNKC